MAELETLAEAPRRPGRPRIADPVAHADRQVEADESQDIRSWLAAIGSQQDVSIKVYRKEPRTWKGKRIDGILGSYNDFVDEEELKERWGGGQYQLVVHKRTQKGNLQFHAARTIRISGDPRFDEDESGTPVASGDAVGQAMAIMTQQVRRAEERADRENRSGFDPAILRAITGPIEAQVAAASQQNIELSRQIAQKDERMLEMITAKPAGSEFQERMLASMLEGESGRIAALRTQHESELRTLREAQRAELERSQNNARDDIKTRERQHERELEQGNKQHEREIDSLKTAHKAVLDGQKLAFDARIDGLKAEQSRLEREVQKLTIENAELRAKKEKSFLESAKEIVGLQQELKGIGIGGADDDDEDAKPKKWYTQVLETVADNPDAIGQMLGGLRGAAPPEPQPVMLAAPPPVRRKKLRPRPPAQLATQAPVDAAPAESETAGAAPTPVVPVAVRRPRPAPVQQVPVGRLPSAEEVSIAVAAMESAINNGTDPVDFATTARMLVPTDVLRQLEQRGVDVFLNEVARLSEGSVLRTQKGRNYARSVSKVLLEGVPA